MKKYTVCQWEKKVFTCNLLDGSAFELRYYQNGDERLVACVDLQKAIGEARDLFSRSYRGFKAKHLDISQAYGYNVRANYCSLQDAIKYANDRFKPFRDTLFERGIQGLIAYSNGDVGGVISSFTDICSKQPYESLISSATQEQLPRLKQIYEERSKHLRDLIAKRAKELESEKSVD